MKKIALIGGLLSIIVLIGAVGCAGNVRDDQLTKITNDVASLQNSINATQQELVSARQTLQQIQAVNSTQSLQAPAANLTANQVPLVNVAVINSFIATPSTITPGQTSTLQWNISGVSAAMIDQNIGTVPASGARVVNPSVTTTYTLTVVNSNGSYVTAQATVSVVTYSYYPYSSAYPYPYYYYTYPYQYYYYYHPYYYDYPRVVKPAPKPAPQPPPGGQQVPPSGR